MVPRLRKAQDPGGLPQSQSGLAAPCEPRGFPEGRSQSEQQRAGEDGTGVTVGTTLSAVPGQLPFPLSRGCTEWKRRQAGPDLPGRREGHTASHVPWPLPSSSVCLSRALGQSSVSRKWLCWASPPAPPTSSWLYQGRGAVSLPPSGQDAGPEVLLLKRAPQPQRVPIPGGVWLACLLWYRCLTLRLSSDRWHRRARAPPCHLWSGALTDLAPRLLGADWPGTWYTVGTPRERTWSVARCL